MGVSRIINTVQQQAIQRSYLRTEALCKLGELAPGGVLFNKTTGLSASNWCQTTKIGLELDFTAVKLLAVNRAGNSIQNFKGVVGVTETDDISSSINMSTPIIGGVSYAQLAPASTVQGFKAITWAGAADITIPAANVAHQIVISDRMPLTSIPRAAGQVSTRPFLLMRTYIPGAIDNWAFVGYNAAQRTPSVANRGRVIQVSSSGSDGVATLTTVHALATSGQEVWPIVTFKRPVLSVWGIGDSITACSSLVADITSNWGHRACCDVSSPTDTPVVWSNFGASSQGMLLTVAAVRIYLAAGVPPPSVLVAGPCSVNDGAGGWNPATLQQARDYGMEVLRLAADYSIPYVVFWPLLPYNVLTSVTDPMRLALNAEFQVIAEAYGVQIMTGLDVLGDRQMPEKWVVAFNSGADGIHPNELAIENVFAPSLARVLRGYV